MERFFRFFRTNLRLGLRIIKTGIAVTFCIAVSNILHLNQPFIAVIATVISMGKSIDLSVKAGKNKMIGAVIGSAVGAAFAAVLPGNAGLCGIGVILSLYLCHFFHLQSAGVLSSFSFAAVMFGAARNAPWQYALSCTGAALLGIAVAVLINLVVMPPNHALEIKKTYSELKKKTAEAIGNAAQKQTAGTKTVTEEIDRISRSVELYISEAKILRWNDEEVFRISSSIAVYRLILDELKAVEAIRLMENGESDEETRTVYQYHMKRMRELFQRAQESEQG
ncbi:Aromatic acid exporter family member 1 [Caprobacter fermentans]|uniref:Aromatic acid exporter family member 1 n=1 Tax=Caproicibacter fermentans TaxID=2576756 RepID=A0A6N8I4X9_9FIRM|nr:aromatic acid exporter family protein [Caproicibacter fermentans]MVB12563.1 Aromatic acid exporter family member 1 [Caproicibacter fermentans]